MEQGCHVTTHAELRGDDAAVTSTAQDNSTDPSETLAQTVTKPKKKKKKKKQCGTTIQQQSVIPTSQGAASVVKNTTDSSTQSNFTQELQWCIAQLKLGLSQADASKPQKQDNEKFIRTLKSEKTPLPRKRQLMKNLFGDYRSRMQRGPVPQYLRTADSEPSISGVGRNQGEGGGWRFYRRSAQNEYSITRDKRVECPGVDGVNGECPGVEGVNGECPGVEGVTGECSGVKGVTVECSGVKDVNSECSGVKGVIGECSGAEGVNSECCSVKRVIGECSGVNVESGTKEKSKTGFCFNFDIEP